MKCSRQKGDESTMKRIIPWTIEKGIDNQQANV